MEWKSDISQLKGIVKLTYYQKWVVPKLQTLQYFAEFAFVAKIQLNLDQRTLQIE